MDEAGLAGDEVITIVSAELNNLKGLSESKSENGKTVCVADHAHC